MQLVAQVDPQRELAVDEPNPERCRVTLGAAGDVVIGIFEFDRADAAGELDNERGRSESWSALDRELLADDLAGARRAANRYVRGLSERKVPAPMHVSQAVVGNAQGVACGRCREQEGTRLRVELDGCHFGSLRGVSSSTRYSLDSMQCHTGDDTIKHRSTGGGSRAVVDNLPVADQKTAGNQGWVRVLADDSGP